MKHCLLCNKELDVPGDDSSIDCGGDCKQCIDEIEQLVTDTFDEGDTMCKVTRHNDQMQCSCGIAWDLGEEKPECKKKHDIVEQAEMMLDENGNRSIFDDVDVNHMCPEKMSLSAHPLTGDAKPIDGLI